MRNGVKSFVKEFIKANRIYGDIMKKEKMYNAILGILRENGFLTRQEIAKKLKISMPTALQYTNELLQMELIMESGEIESTGGRKAKILSVNQNIAYSVGIEIGIHHVTFVLLGYMGTVLCEERCGLIFQDERDWYRSFQEKFKQFTEKYAIETERILCGGISFPGIIDEEKNMILRSHILNVEFVALDRFQNAFPFPIMVVNDANCAAMTETRTHKMDYLYISLNESVGGGIIRNGKIHYGNSLQAGEIGHVILVPGGKKCYCGKKGCADAYLSSKVLCENETNLSDFFEKLKSGEESVCKKWNQYLNNLAILITNMKMVQDTDIIVGGEVGMYMGEYVDELMEKVQEYDMFARNIDYVFTCDVQKHVCAIGAGWIALQRHYGDVIHL